MTGLPNRETSEFKCCDALLLLNRYPWYSSSPFVWRQNQSKATYYYSINVWSSSSLECKKTYGAALP